MELDGRTRIYCIIGDPVEYSLSPAMHNAAFRSLGLNCAYIAFRISPEVLRDAVRGLKALGVEGFNVTIPHKVEIMRHLDEVDPVAKAIGAVNTVKRVGKKLHGYNTDGAGAITALTEAGVTLPAKKAVLMGAGGAARAIAFTLASKVRDLVILNRTVAKGAELAEALKEHSKITVRAASLNRTMLTEELAEADLLINATSTGMRPQPESPVASDLLRPGMVVFDIVYSPLETQLLREARSKGLKTVDGVGMLVHQGARSFEIWLGKKPPIDVMRNAVLERLGRG